MKLGFILIALSMNAAAEVSVGVFHETQDSERLKAVTGIQVRAGGDAYLWGSYSKPDVQLMGQNLGKVDLYGAGLGLRHKWDRVSVFGEFGWFKSDESTTKTSIQNESILAALKHDHGRIPFHPTQTTYSLSNGYGGRLGASCDVSDWLRVSAAYRSLKLNEGYDACTGNDGSCDFPHEKGHWQNRKTLNFSGVEFGVSLVF